ncbi:pyridoxamine 5'-phosphate oxidase family protein [Aestuariispira insulae]|uniref:Nitroimidazol reductase NimA-like FMN-containing flavoprotein (Pyridoxamine 5'-phosphate oxidase superfamily) n=1 Tax=Aestuariispira insulae TaxID=1461337 RepID=A0A3D9HGB5_9PROT|nr:pyridoxamine 5'-phosphate oxidase family protein [Aestuariispira insulae]RED48036.1 hypothetical protein DFP90_10854 [Aestuariispira insulae]
MSEYNPSQISRVKRVHRRAAYDFKTVHGILDAAHFCHVGYVIDDQPYVTPTLHWRDGNRLYWHGSSASRMLRQVKTGVPVCVTASLFDGYVLARSAFHHSANYRAVMAFGKAKLIEDPAKAEAALKLMMDNLWPGRWEELRPVRAQEIKATTVVTMEIEEASAKIRTGGPVDDEDDYALPIWAGVEPARQIIDPLVADPRLTDGIPIPDYLE